MLGFGRKPQTVDEFILGYWHHHDYVARKTPMYRPGQAAWNYAWHHFPEACRPLIATDCDPFYSDDRERRIRLLSHLADSGVISWGA